MTAHSPLSTESSVTPIPSTASIKSTGSSSPETEDSAFMVRTNNMMHQNVAMIARNHGHDPLTVVPLFKDLSSADFCLGPPDWDDTMKQIPGAVWKEVAEHYDLSRQSPFECLNAECHPAVFKEKSPVFVARKYTERLVAEQLMVEGFSTAQRLYQYLNWTMRINKVSRTMNLLEGRSGERVLLINTELHDRRRRELYALCIPNDVISPKAQKWQLAALYTASELSQSLDIDYHHFPRGVRACSPQFERFRMLRAGTYSIKTLKELIRRRDAKRKIIRYQQLKCVLAGNGRATKRNKCSADKVLTVHLSSFYAKVRSALESPYVDLVPMVSIVSKKLYHRKEEDFSVDYLLPVRVGQDWVGVVYRDLDPIMALMDVYDITNKAVLCDPCLSAEDMPFEQGPYNRLKILPDHEWDTSSMEWVMMYSNAYFEQFAPRKTHLVPPNYHC